MKEHISRFIIALFIGATILLLYRYHRGYDDSIQYNVTTSAESSEFGAYPFTKGPFQFSFTGKIYDLAEVFAAGPISRDLTAESGFLVLILIGLCLTISISTTLSRTMFIGVMILFILFIISLNLPEIHFFGIDSESSSSVIVLLILIVIPAYTFHAFLPQVNLTFRFISFVGIIAGIVFFSGVSQQAMVDQFTVGSHFGLIIFGIIFLFLIAEENVFAILYIITKSKGGKNNHIHFIVFSLVYLGILGLYYGKKSGTINTEVAFFDPFVLLAISGLVSLWTYQYKKDLFENLLDSEQMRNLLAAIGIIFLGFLSLAMYRGNDAIYEGFHYLIIYTHLGFGVFFFLYVLTNLMTPLLQGLQVFKVVYKKQNFPYASARLAGLVGVAAFFFLANKEPFLLFRAGHFNYLGAQAEQTGESMLAAGYYNEGTVYGHDNHFSNYKLGYRELQKGDLKEANFRFGRAALRYPSPQAYINKAGTFALMAEATPSLVSLKEGLRDFPSDPQLQNNLGLTYADQGKKQEAMALLEKSDMDGKWTNANLVNLWKLKETHENATTDFEKGNLAVKTNILKSLLSSGQHVDLNYDSILLNNSYALHKITYLINSSWYFSEPTIPQQIEKSLGATLTEDVYWDAKHAAALSYFGQGNINQAMRTLDQLVAEANGKFKAQLLNEMGLIALSQHSIKEALRFFEQAIGEGSQAALVNKQACLLEVGDFDEAAAWSNYLLSIDSSYLGLRNDLIAMSSKENLPENLQSMRMYYQYDEYSNAEMSVILSQTNQGFQQSLWAKIVKESLSKENIEQYEHYKKLFLPLLSEEYFVEPDFIVSLQKDSSSSDYLLNQLLTQHDSSSLTQLESILKQNAYNEPLILGVVRYLKVQNNAVAYQILLEATAINKTSHSLRKEFVREAVKSGLNRYADDMLAELQLMMTPEEFKLFNSSIQILKAKIASQVW